MLRSDFYSVHLLKTKQPPTDTCIASVTVNVWGLSILERKKQQQNKTAKN